MATTMLLLAACLFAGADLTNLAALVPIPLLALYFFVLQYIFN